jgi:hypothetical protein
MDKLKEQLAVVSKYSFWIMCGGILLVCLGSWWVATAKLAQQQKTQLEAIKTNFTAMESLRGSNPKHPNAATAEGMAQLLRTYSVEVMRGWQLQYDQQATVLVWPASFDDVFRERVDKLRPIEIVPPPPTPIDKDLPIRERQLYRDFIADEIPTLAKTIGAEWRAVATATAGDGFGGSGSGLGGGASGYGSSGFGAPGMGPGGLGSAGPGMMPTDGSNPAAMLDDKSIVMWNTANQQELLGTHFSFITREEPPSTLDVLYAQEDLWILQNIMDIIRAANRDVDGKDATARHEATVKMIDFVRIGRSAMGLAGRISPVGAAANAGGMDGGSGMGSMGMGSGDAASMMASGSMGAPEGGGTSTMMPMLGGSPDSMGSGMGMGGVGAISTDPAFGRYVDEKYQPLDPAKLRSALTSKSPADALLAVAKRMPVRMRFTIDQRRLNRLLAECGNSRLPVEVRQVRVNREPAAAGGAGGSYDGMGGGSSSMMSGGGMSMPGMGGFGGSGGMGAMGSPDGGSMMPSGGMSSYPGGMPGMGGIGGMGGPGSASRPVGGDNSTAAVDQNLIVVELYGIVYVYNPVNKSQLGLEDTTTTAAAPVAEPATVTPTTPVSSPAPGEAPTATGTVPPAAIVPPVGAGS